MDRLDGRLDWILLAVLITKTVEDTSFSAWRAEKLAHRVGSLPADVGTGHSLGDHY